MKIKLWRNDMKIIVPLAAGFEETEAMTVVDILRRAGLNTVTAAVNDNPVQGSHQVKITADILLNEDEKYDAIVLPGGMPGTTNLRNDKKVAALVKSIYSAGGITAAICAAPVVLGDAGILKNKKFTCYPGFENEINDGEYTPETVVVTGNIITGKGPGAAVPFALKLVEIFSGSAASIEVKDSFMWPY
jgi:4-methyl-5(b-hydroxyethyl)-thiazole monophosphate biosynthesis